MRKIVVVSMISLDGVLQAPGGPEEDTSGGFAFGGWSVPFDDDGFNSNFAPLMGPTDLLLGRLTFDIFESYWPLHAENWPGIDEVVKNVVSTTRTSSTWNNSAFLGGVDDVRALKAGPGGDLTVWGSGDLVQTLFAADLVDEFALVTYPVTLGQGKRLFAAGTIPATFTVSDAAVTPSGVVFARYTRAGDIVTGTVGE